MAVVAHNFGPSTWKAEAEVSSRPPWSIEFQDARVGYTENPCLKNTNPTKQKSKI